VTALKNEKTDGTFVWKKGNGVKQITPMTFNSLSSTHKLSEPGPWVQSSQREMAFAGLGYCFFCSFTILAARLRTQVERRKKIDEC